MVVNNNQLHEMKELTDGHVCEDDEDGEDGTDTSANVTRTSVSMWQQCLNTQGLLVATEASSRIATSLIVAISFLLLVLSYFLGYYLDHLYRLDLVIVSVVGTISVLIILLTLVLDWQPRCWDKITFKVTSLEHVW